ncbi:Acetyltransferase (GNAT) family protein [Actinoplanes derwentensis]|uniref:Acetyltransferase (GNAT) family protein n=1 Tax=Actinoplanes derwentensis TaxID=113562 RepID=A0A1H2BY75_9ACTN|nr:Acetyltransferase (GNAT) family protein [Actinoplanes derwentensis]
MAVSEVGAADSSVGHRGVTVETEGLSAAAEALFVARGFRQVFAEDVLRIDLTGNDGSGPEPEPVANFESGWVPGAEVVEWGTGVAERFHAVYGAAFRERPGFPDPSAEEWIEETAEEYGFRPDWSLLVTVPGIGDAGFVTAAAGWIVQVGVVPAARGAGLGAALIRESLRRAAVAGFGESWLCVNVDNPAGALYRRLGFQDRGRRARFQLRG